VTDKLMATRQNSRRQVREHVKDAYSAAAERPGDNHPFPVGRELALGLGYPEKLIDSLPAVSVETMAGVSNVSIFAEIPPGSTVLDLGCGAGVDSMIAAGKTGLAGKVIGVDFSPAMLARARQGAAESGASNVSFFESGGENLPIPDASVDVALFNGVFNLNLDRRLLFSELFRVLRTGGTVYGAELILREPINDEERESANWFA
jgi:arsenite methyltransferase